MKVVACKEMSEVKVSYDLFALYILNLCLHPPPQIEVISTFYYCYCYYQYYYYNFHTTFHPNTKIYNIIFKLISYRKQVTDRLLRLQSCYISHIF